MDRDPDERKLDRMIAVGLFVLGVGLIVAMISMFTW